MEAKTIYSFNDDSFLRNSDYYIPGTFKKIHDASLEPINFIKLEGDEKSLPDGEICETIVDEPELRENWKGKADFFLSVLAYAVGLGAVWRFPYLCYKNGGGVFLIPYFIFLVLVGIPLVFLELCVGQFTSTGPLTCWRMTPLFRGIGLSMNIVNGYLCVYYNMILAYSLYYLYITFIYISGDLPWQNCNSKWASSNCFDGINTKNFSFVQCKDKLLNIKCDSGECFSTLTRDNKTVFSCTGLNNSSLISLGFWKPEFPSQDFWTNLILEKSNGIDQSGHIVWHLVIALFFAWVMVYLMVINGIKVSGKLVYFTALFPYLVLLLLGIRGWLLPGSGIGINYYINPDFSRLADQTVWMDAANQIFFTLSVSYGGLIALSSYNTFHNNIMRDAILVSLSNCVTSVFAGFVVFAYLGYLSHMTGQDMANIIQAGQGLAYVVYPFAVTTIKGASFWAILFFIMMLVLGIDTMMASVETLITSLFDIMPKIKERKSTRILAITLICLILFSIGIIFCFQSGTFWIEIFDNYSGSWGILLVAAIECISVGWFYGFDNFKKDISTMLGSHITDHYAFNLWRICWCFVSPCLLIAIVIFNWVDNKSFELNGYLYPEWSVIVGNFLTISTLSGVIIWALWALIDALFINPRPLKTLIVADNGWKPIKAEHRILVSLVHSKKRIENDSKEGGKSNECFNVIEVEKF